MRKTSGIYTITNIVNNKMYVGRATSLSGRCCGHKRELRKGTHKNIHLQSAWNKYGEDKFLFEVLEECPIEYTASQENYWCNLLDVHNRKYGYNALSTSPHGGHVKTPEVRAKLSIAHKKLIANDPERRYRLVNIARKIGFKNIAAKKIWSDKERKDMSERKKKQGNAHMLTPECHAKRLLLFPKVSVLQYSADGTFIKEWDRISIAAEHVGANPPNITRVCKIMRDRKCKGFIWRYKTENYPLSLSF